MRDFSIAAERGKSQAMALGIASLTAAAFDISLSLGLGAGSGLMPPGSYLLLYGVLGIGVSVLLGFFLGGHGKFYFLFCLQPSRLRESNTYLQRYFLHRRTANRRTMPAHEFLDLIGTRGRPGLDGFVFEKTPQILA